MKRTFARFAVITALMLHVTLGFLNRASAQGETDTEGAANAFREGQQAQLGGNHARAAEMFDIAYRAAPSPQAARSAMRSHQLAGHKLAAASMAQEALERYPNDDETKSLASSILSDARAELANMEVNCSPACSVLVDGRSMSFGRRKAHVLWLNPGQRFVAASWGRDHTEGGLIFLNVGTVTTRTYERPADKKTVSPVTVENHGDASVDEASRRGISPAVFVTLAGLTAVGAGFTIWSRLDTLDARDAYEANPTREGFDDGIQKETRTNILLGVSAGLGVAALTTAIFTNWRGNKSDKNPKSTKVQLQPVVTARSASLRLDAVF